MPIPYQVLLARPEPSLLSLVIPLYNEQEVVPLLRERLDRFLIALSCPVEVILVNDGSTDQTLDLLLDWAARDRRVQVLGLARNFGHQIAATAGLDHAAGDAVVLMDADLQDPPEVVSRMVERYRQGYDVVYGQRTSRAGETRFKLITAWAFYRIMRAFVHKDLPSDAGDFRLLSRRCLDGLKSMREVHRFLRGMVAWVGFAQIGVPYERPARAAGTTKYPLDKMLRLAWNAMVSFSPLPLRISFFLGSALAVSGAGWALYAIARHVLVGDTVPGWTSQVVITCLSAACILVSNGILGEYVGRIFEEIKGRPLYLVATRTQVASTARLAPTPSNNHTKWRAAG
ncbi:MAG: glycosyltransferase family 2 protein [Candidatus Acidiferrum sp.]